MPLRRPDLAVPFMLVLLSVAIGCRSREVTAPPPPPDATATPPISAPKPTSSRHGDVSDSRFFRRGGPAPADKPGGLAFDGKSLWVADRVAQLVRAVDLESGRTVGELPAPGPWPSGLAHDGELLWVADKQRSKIFGIDVAQKLVTREIDSPTAPQGMAFDGSHLWVADGKNLHQISREDGTTITSVPAPGWDGGSRPSQTLGLAFSADYLWVSDRNDDRIYEVAPATGDVVDFVPAPDPLTSGLTATPQGLYAAGVDRQQLFVGVLPWSKTAKVVQSQPRRQTVVLRRRIDNGGPGVLQKATIFFAVPTSNDSQELSGTVQFSARPSRRVRDQWGQAFAVFEAENIPPGGSFSAAMTVPATLYAVRYHIDPEMVGSLAAIPRDISRQFLGDGTKYQIRHPSIVRHLRLALGDETRPYWMVRRLAKYVQDHMHYELAGGWNIAPTVIDRGSGSCSEYTFVFVALCRAAGIPARYVGAIVVRGDAASSDDVFHRWAEVYLPSYGWMPVDVQAGDKTSPAEQLEALFGLSSRFLITTTGGGGSSIIGWDYNSAARWTCRGRCDVSDYHVGDWYPARPAPETP